MMTLGRQKQTLCPLLCCLLTAAAYLTVCSKCSFLYPLNDWVDVNIYFTIGKGLFQGKVPYLDLYDQKGPVVFLLYGLASLLSDSSMIGVYLLETLSFGGFLYACYRIVGLYEQENRLLVIPLLGALILSSMSISHGGSLEEFCLLPFSCSLYASMRYWKERYPEKPFPLRSALLHGFLAGLILFAKFNLLGFYLAFMGTIALGELAQKRIAHALALCAGFLGAMALAGVPFLIYFACRGALPEFFHYYFYSNLFGYSYLEPPILPNILLAIVRSTAATFLRNPRYSLLILLGIGWFTFRKGAAKPVERINLWATAVLLTCGVYCGGQGYRYYGIVLAVFAVLGIVPLLRLYNRTVAPRLSGMVRRLLPAALSLCGFLLCLLLTSNRYLLSYERADTPQYRFAAKMEALSEDRPVTLLNCGFPDSGFYLAADVLPACRFFTTTNVPLPEVSREQQRFLQEGLVEFAVTRDREDPPMDGYVLVDTASLYYEEYTSVYRLYRRADGKESSPHEP